jgi:hypothetical protein
MHQVGGGAIQDNQVDLRAEQPLERHSEVAAQSGERARRVRAANRTPTSTSLVGLISPRAELPNT